MKIIAIGLAAAIAAVAAIVEATTCTGAAGNQFSAEEALEWCSHDHGFNEGAVCGATALANLGSSGVPAAAAGAILGNTWDRTDMMGAARVAARVGQVDAAVDAAMCCQLHNPDAYKCLVDHRAAVQQWLTK